MKDQNIEYKIRDARQKIKNTKYNRSFSAMIAGTWGLGTLMWLASGNYLVAGIFALNVALNAGMAYSRQRTLNIEEEKLSQLEQQALAYKSIPAADAQQLEPARQYDTIDNVVNTEEEKVLKL